MLTFLISQPNPMMWPSLKSSLRKIPMSGNIIGFGREIRKLAFWKLSILDLICCPGKISSSKPRIILVMFSTNPVMGKALPFLLPCSVHWVQFHVGPRLSSLWCRNDEDICCSVGFYDDVCCSSSPGWASGSSSLYIFSAWRQKAKSYIIYDILW